MTHALVDSRGALPYHTRVACRRTYLSENALSPGGAHVSTTFMVCAHSIGGDRWRTTTRVGAALRRLGLNPYMLASHSESPSGYGSLSVVKSRSYAHRCRSSKPCRVRPFHPAVEANRISLGRNAPSWTGLRAAGPSHFAPSHFARDASAAVSTRLFLGVRCERWRGRHSSSWPTGQP